MNTNPTALSLAAILASAERMKTVVEDLMHPHGADLVRDDYNTITDAVEELGRRNGNSAAVLWTLADSMKNGKLI